MTAHSNRELRLLNETRDELAELTALNPGRLGPPIGPDPLSGRVRIPVRSLRTSFQEGSGAVVRQGSVELELAPGRTYPFTRPGLFVRSRTPLFLAGVRQMPWLGGVWFGPVCVLRHYDREVHGLVSHVLGAWDVLTGQVVGSEADCLNKAAAAWWLAREHELPLDRCLTLPSGLALPAPTFELEPLGPEEVAE